MMLGTFRNPAGFEGRCGFEPPADRRVGAMLAWRDVIEPLNQAWEWLALHRAERP